MLDVPYHQLGLPTRWESYPLLSCHPPFVLSFVESILVGMIGLACGTGEEATKAMLPEISCNFPGIFVISSSAFLL